MFGGRIKHLVKAGHGCLLCEAPVLTKHTVAISVLLQQSNSDFSRIEDMLDFQVRLDDDLPVPQRVRPSTKYGLETLESGAEGIA